jgi:WD40 repeat protein
LNVVATVPHNKYINCMDYAKSGKLAAIGDIDGAVKVFDTETKSLVGKQFNNHGRGVKCLKFSPDS